MHFQLHGVLAPLTPILVRDFKKLFKMPWAEKIFFKIRLCRKSQMASPHPGLLGGHVQSQRFVHLIRILLVGTEPQR